MLNLMLTQFREGSRKQKVMKHRVKGTKQTNSQTFKIQDAIQQKSSEKYQFKHMFVGENIKH